MLFMKREGFQNKEIRFTELPELLKSKNPMGTKNLLDLTLNFLKLEVKDLKSPMYWNQLFWD